MSSEISTDLVSASPFKRVRDVLGPRAVMLRQFKRLRPRVHPWIQIVPQQEGGGELFDEIMLTRLRLNRTACLMVEHLCAGEQTLGEIAGELAEKFGRDESEMLIAVVNIYKQLESRDATVHPRWRYWTLYLAHSGQYLKRVTKVFSAEFTRGLGRQ